MSNLEKIDKDLKIETSIEEDNIKFYNVKDEPFDLYGFCSAEKGEQFLRMPVDIAAAINPFIGDPLCRMTSGGRVRFKTNSPYVAISVKYPNPRVMRMNHMSMLGTTGFDMYVYKDGEYKYSNMRNFIPPNEILLDGYESIHYFKNTDLKDITINFPLYNEVLELYIGIEDGSVLDHGEKYINERPVVCYGSSIAQGACASRPGNSYMGMISRRFNLDFLNLGFSGSAKGEKEMAKYIGNLHPGAFICEYDQDAPDAKYLEKTHERFFKIIREKNPDIPIILMSSIYRQEWTQEIYDSRKAVILKTYNNAVNSGDKNVYYLDCQRIFDIFGGDNGTTDGSHPNDLGFMCMAEGISKVLKAAMNLK